MTLNEKLAKYILNTGALFSHDYAKPLADGILKLIEREAAKCIWEYDEWHECWHTTCGNAHSFIALDPPANGYKFCPYCGGRLKIKERKV
ncbi:MAG: hypothetical protein ONB55_21820 [candidate division KSB1 bacterium]|nr:hypothetical protein [candidate division KSB1 bacterium]